MRVTTIKRRNRAITILMLPAAIFMFVVGWAFFWIGHQQKVSQKTQPSHRKDGVTLMAALEVEEPQEIPA